VGEQAEEDRGGVEVEGLEEGGVGEVGVAVVVAAGSTSEMTRKCLDDFFNMRAVCT